MEDIQIVLTVAFAFTGLFTLLLGYLIRKNQLVEMIALPNVKIEKIKDKEAFSQFAAKRTYLIGGLALLMAVMMACLHQFIMIAAVVFSLAVIVICIEFLVASKKHIM